MYTRIVHTYMNRIYAYFAELLCILHMTCMTDFCVHIKSRIEASSGPPPLSVVTQAQEECRGSNVTSVTAGVFRFHTSHEGLVLFLILKFLSKCSANCSVSNEQKVWRSLRSVRGLFSCIMDHTQTPRDEDSSPGCRYFEYIIYY